MWIIIAWQCTSPEVIPKGFKECCISNAVGGTEDDVMWNDSAEEGNVRNVRKMKAVTVKMETETMIGKGRQDLTCFVYSVYEITSKIFFLSRCFIFGCHLRFG
jgi:hypothetical protein